MKILATPWRRFTTYVRQYESLHQLSPTLSAVRYQFRDTEPLDRRWYRLLVEPTGALESSLCKADINQIRNDLGLPVSDLEMDVEVRSIVVCCRTEWTAVRIGHLTHQQNSHR